MRTQRERVAESSRRLAAAAIELIAEQGFSRTTAKDIGIRAGYSRAMLAERFGTKEALLDYVLAKYYQERIAVRTDPGPTALDALLSPLDALISFARDDPDTLRAMFVISFEAVHDAEVIRPRITSQLQTLRTDLAAAASAGQADGSIVDTRAPSDIAADLMATGIGHAFAWVVGMAGADIAETLERARDQARAALTPA